MTDIVFLDTETLGLDPSAPIWEFAALRIPADPERGGSQFDTFTIRHEPRQWMATLPDSFVRDYHARYDPATALREYQAARRIWAITDGGAIIAGSNPAFDMQRLEVLLIDNGFKPAWHYHPLDVPTMALGWLAARGWLPPQPWKSDEISRACGIEPELFRRHTAVGDVEWTRALYEWITQTSKIVPVR